jgi:hypothetical protein
MSRATEGDSRKGRVARRLISEEPHQTMEERDALLVAEAVEDPVDLFAL